MSDHFTRRRRTLTVLGVCALGVTPAWLKAQGVQKSIHRQPVHDVRILVLGDSLSAEYGLARGTGWVALLGCVLVTAGLRGLALWRNWQLPAWRI